MADPVATQRKVRTDLTLEGRLTDSDGGQLDVIVRDFSHDGCKLDTDGSLMVGERVELHVGKSAPVTAIVRWVMIQEAGIEFLT